MGSAYGFLPQLKTISQYNANELISELLATALMYKIQDRQFTLSGKISS